MTYSYIKILICSLSFLFSQSRLIQGVLLNQSKEKISNVNSSLMDQNNYQCKDCRVRANTISNDKAELYFSNSPLAKNGNKI